MTNKMKPIHPGEILKDELDVLKISPNTLAKKLSIPASLVKAILNGTQSINIEIALRLGLLFRTTPEFWLNLQTAYDLKLLITQEGKRTHEIEAMLMIIQNEEDILEAQKALKDIEKQGSISLEEMKRRLDL